MKLAAKVTARAGYDRAPINTDHSPNDDFSVLSQLQVITACGTDARHLAEASDSLLATIKGGLA